MICGVSHSFKLYSQCAGLLRLPDQVMVTAVLCFTNMYLNCTAVSVLHSVFFIITASPPPHSTENIVFHSTVSVKLLRVFHDRVLCYGVYWKWFMPFQPNQTQNFKMFARSALETGMIHSNITANCMCSKVIKSQLIKLAVDMETCF